MTYLRNQQIIAAYLAGQTVTSLATEHNVSRQRINQLVRQAGAPLRKPGMAERKMALAEDQAARRTARANQRLNREPDHG